jgi:3-phenylpropionate/cinnamic acid dioxygenase small subunit
VLVVDTAIYQEIQHFYARQMRALDEGDVVAWARTFEPDGVFDANGLPEPVRGRELIESGARKAWEQQRAEGIQTRHWLGMLEVEERADGTLVARTYALVLRTPKGGQTAVTVSTSCKDVLVRDGGIVVVRYRTVRRDDLEG